MAQQEVLNISLRDYKKDIESLKGTLLGLDRESQEYAKTLSDLQAKQQKLNQVTRDAKRDDDALEGSYNGLVASMARLKEEWRATNDVAKRNELGLQIESINTQLKELDLSIGNSQRNVGNYEGATVSLKQQLRELNDAMTKMLASGIKQTDPAFVELAKKAGSIKDAMMDAKAATKEYADDVRGMTVATDVVKNLAAGYGTVTSAMQLFGASTEDAQKITAKMTTVMTLLNSVSAINKAINDSASPTRKLLISLWQQLTGAKQADVIATVESTTAEQVNTSATNAQTVALNGQTVATKAATVATKAWKVALISTGIGALIVAIGELIAHWNDLTKILKENTEFLKKLGPQFQALAVSMELAAAKEKELKENTDYFENSLESVGETVATNVSKFNKLRSSWHNLRTEGEKVKWLKEHRSEMKGLGIAVNDTRSAEILFNKQSTNVVNAFMARARAAAAEKLEIEALKEAYVAAQKNDLEAVQEAGRKHRAAQQLLKESLALAKQATNEMNNAGVKFSNDTPERTGGGKKDTSTSTEDPKVAKEKEKIAEAQEKENKALREYKNITNEIAKQRSIIGILGYEKGIKRLKPEWQELAKTFGKEWFTNFDQRSVDAFQGYVDKVRKINQDLINNGEITGERLTKITEEWNKKEVELEENKQKQIDDIEVKSIANEKERREQTIRNRIQETEFYMDFFVHEMEAEDKLTEPKTTFFQRFMGITPEKSDEMQSRIREFKMNTLSDLISFNEELLQEIDPTTHAYEEQIQAIEKLKQAFNDLVDEQNAATEANKNNLNKQTADYQKWASSISGLFNAVKAVQDAELDRKVKKGKISEEEAKKEFERNKNVQIAGAIVTTLAGATAAFMRDVQTYWPPESYVLGAIDAATTLATGYANVQQIKNQQYGGSSGLNASSAAGGGHTVATAPLLSPTLDSLSLQNIQVGQTGMLNDKIDNQRVYILQSDLEKSGKQVEIRQRSTTF